MVNRMKKGKRGERTGGKGRAGRREAGRKIKKLGERRGKEKDQKE